MPAPKTFRLTRTTYYDADRPHLSNSQISDYLYSKEYFYKKHILKDPEYEFETTDAMKCGSIVDDLLTNNGRTKYQPKVKRTVLKRDDPDQYELETELIEAQELMDPEYLVSPAVYLEAVEIADALKATELWQSAKNKRFQILLHDKIHGLPYCGLADMSAEYKGKTLIIDIKRTNTGDMKDERRWLKKAEAFGYDRQLAGYVWMHSRKYKKPIADYRAMNLCVAYNKQKKTVEIKLFEYSHDQLKEALEVTSDAVARIKAKDFEDDKVSFDNPIQLDYRPTLSS